MACFSHLSLVGIPSLDLSVKTRRSWGFSRWIISIKYEKSYLLMVPKVGNSALKNSLYT